MRSKMFEVRALLVRHVVRIALSLVVLTACANTAPRPAARPVAQPAQVAPPPSAIEHVMAELATAELTLARPDERVRQCNLLIDKITKEQSALDSASGSDPKSLRSLAEALRQVATAVSNVPIDDQPLVKLRDDYAKMRLEIADVSERAAKAMEAKNASEGTNAAKEMAAFGPREEELVGAINEHCQTAYAQPDADAEAECLKGATNRCLSAGAYHDTNEAHYDERRALDLYQRGCSGGDAKSCASAAIAYGEGRGASRNKDRAVELHTRACKLGLADSCSAVAERLWDAKRTPRQEELALRLWRSACTAGESRACELWLEHGKEGTREALDALCEGGNARACETLDPKRR